MRFARTIAVTALLAAAAPAFAADEDAVVKFRKDNMSVIGSAMHNIVAQLKGEAPVSDQIAPYAEILHQASLLTVPAFKVKATGFEEKSTAKEDVWNDWAKFESGVKKLQEESAKLAEVAASGDMGAIGAQVQAVGKTCKGCHDNFRQKN